MHRMGRTRGSLRTDAGGERPCGFYHSSLQREYIPYFRSARREADGKGKIERETDRGRRRTPKGYKESIRRRGKEGRFEDGPKGRTAAKRTAFLFFKGTIFFIYEMAREITLIDRER